MWLTNKCKKWLLKVFIKIQVASLQINIETSKCFYSKEYKVLCKLLHTHLFRRQKIESKTKKTSTSTASTITTMSIERDVVLFQSDVSYLT